MRIVKDEKGGSQAVAFLILSFVLVFILFSFIEPIKMAFGELGVVMAYKKGLDKMQQTGGLTPTIEGEIKTYLSRFGFDENNITVDGTIGPVNWGNEVGLQITANKEVSSYSFTGLIGLKKEVKSEQFNIDGSTTSYYNNNS